MFQDSETEFQNDTVVIVLTSSDLFTYGDYNILSTEFKWDVFAKKKENRLVTAAVQMMVYDNKTCIIHIYTHTYVTHVSRRAKIYITIKSQQCINHRKYQTHDLIYLFVCWSLLFFRRLKTLSLSRQYYQI